MHLSNALFLCHTFIAATVAQNPTTTSLHFTTIPTDLVAGVEQTIGWAGGNGNGVNIILQQGPAENLKDVPIPPIASGKEGNSTTWTPPKSLPDAGNYALRIDQDEDSVNYSGMLQLFGGCSTCPTDALAALASTSTSSTGSLIASSPSPTVASGSKLNSNSTGFTASSGNSTIIGSSMNSTMGTGSMANMTMSGTNSTTNFTVSTAKLHATSTTSKSYSTSSTSISSSSSESTPSSTGSSASPSATTRSSGVAVAASNFALVLCAVVGVLYLR